MSALINEKEYLEQRLQDQIDWYEAKSRLCQKRFKTIRSLEIVTAAAIPFLSGYSGQIPHMELIVGMLGLLIAISAGLLGLHQYQERWAEYRSAAEALKREKFLFLAGAEPYDGEHGFAMLVQRVEARLADEHNSWAQSAQSSSKSSGDRGDSP
jgi:hypothetical protein